MKYGLYRHLIPIENPATIATFEVSYFGLITAEKNARTILPYSQRFNPNLTLHDASHSERVIELINIIVDIIESNGGSLSDVELELLYYSAWYHDMGILLSYKEYSNRRSPYNHAELSAKILKKYTDEFFKISPEYIDGFRDAVCTIIISHKNGSDNIPETYELNGNTVRLKMLCSILCLADLCDISEKRAPKIVYSLLTDELNTESLDSEEKKHWAANISTNIQIKSDKPPLIIVNYQNRDECKVIIDSVERYGNEHIDNINSCVTFPVKIVYIEGLPQ